MSELQLIYLSILQGITEFMPVSSSGHLILVSKFTTLPDQGQDIDIALHIGSILAVMIYFAPTLWNVIVGMLKSKLLPNTKIEGSQLFYLLLVATLPALCVGAALKYYGMEWLRSTKVIGWNILFYGILLWIIDSLSITVRKVKNLEMIDALYIGLAQCLALSPGTSRSGITITMCRFLGMERREAAKFSMLLAIPTILAAGVYAGYELYAGGNMQLILNAFHAIGYSFIVSILAIFVLMQWLKRWSFFPFVVYRLVLGIVLLLDAYGIYDIKALFM